MAQQEQLRAQLPSTVSNAEIAELSHALAEFSDSSIHPNQLMNASPESLGNSVDMEYKWAANAFKHAEVYWRILQTSKNCETVFLTSLDDDIYAHFRKMFPDLKINVVSDEILKSEAAKVKWREFCNAYDDNRVRDFNLATLLRYSCSEDYSEANSTIVPRIQFLAIEIARNREGWNRVVAKNK